ncbi:MAG: nitroreductase [Clostridiales bacterium]|nr:nitroreductase [Clostridiales bacterium]
MFLDLAKKRYSLRTYQDKEVERDKILAILEAARLSPSAVNKQPLHYLVVTNKEQRQKLVDSYPRDWFKDAPVIIVVCLDHSKSWVRRDGKDHGDIDGGIAIANMTLAATDLGLGTCIVCHFDSKKVEQDFNLPSHMEAIALLPVGYPTTDDIPEKKRNSIDELTTWIE